MPLSRADTPDSIICSPHSVAVGAKAVKRRLSAGAIYSLHKDARAIPSAKVTSEERCKPRTVTSPTSERRSPSTIIHTPDEFGPWLFDPRTDAKTAKWWSRRYTLFSKYDEGIRLDREAWFEVTPENLADHIARKLATRGMIIDGFAGAGGNTIAFAKKPRVGLAKVIAVDIDPERVAMAKHNSGIYGVSERIDFHHADFRTLAPLFCLQQLNAPPADASRTAPSWTFLSPPWGPRYPAKLKSGQVYDLVRDLGQGLDGAELLRLALRVSADCCYYLPKNTCTAQLKSLAEELGATLELELAPAGKALLAYFRLKGSSCWPDLPADAVGAESSLPHVRGLALTRQAIELMPPSMRDGIKKQLTSEYDPSLSYQLMSIVPRCQSCGAVRNQHNPCFCRGCFSAAA